MAGTCKYQYSATERYQQPGVGTTCGAATHHAVDVPEVTRLVNSAGQYIEHVTGRLLARQEPDAHCPAHGGTPDPENPTVPVGPGSDAMAAIETALNLIRTHASNLVTVRGEVSALHAKLDNLGTRFEALLSERASAAAAAAAPAATGAPLDWKSLAAEAQDLIVQGAGAIAASAPAAPAAPAPAAPAGESA